MKFIKTLYRTLMALLLSTVVLIHIPDGAKNGQILFIVLMVYAVVLSAVFSEVDFKEKL